MVTVRLSRGLTVASIHDRFPNDLLIQPEAVRLAYFEQIVIAHPLLTEKLSETIQAIHPTQAARVVQVIGPTGVGKSTLRQLTDSPYAAKKRMIG
jgi:flagellar biosynthesis GTPase FlhF